MRLAQIIRIAMMSLCLACLMGIPGLAFAQDDCYDLNTNEEWVRGLKEIIQLMENKDYARAQSNARKLSRICEKSPMLNYIQGIIARGAIGPLMEWVFWNSCVGVRKWGQNPFSESLPGMFCREIM